MKFVVRKNKGGEFYWQLVGGNGEVMANSEGMTSKQSVIDSIDSIKRNAGGAEVVDKSDEG
ncbi:MAG: YegP family protein [Mycobacterium sp.]